MPPCGGIFICQISFIRKQVTDLRHHFKRFLLFVLRGILFASTELKLMQKNLSLLVTLFALAVSVSSCEVVGGIFKAGVWTGFIVIVLVVGLILWLVSRGRNRG